MPAALSLSSSPTACSRVVYPRLHAQDSSQAQMTPQLLKPKCYTVYRVRTCTSRDVALCHWAKPWELGSTAYPDNICWNHSRNPTCPPSFVTLVASCSSGVEALKVSCLLPCYPPRSSRLAHNRARFVSSCYVKSYQTSHCRRPGTNTEHMNPHHPRAPVCHIMYLSRLSVVGDSVLQLQCSSRVHGATESFLSFRATVSTRRVWHRRRTRRPLRPRDESTTNYCYPDGRS
jgi:hypothetical protein